MIICKTYHHQGGVGVRNYEKVQKMEGFVKQVCFGNDTVFSHVIKKTDFVGPH